jgi:hypothetical protein
MRMAITVQLIITSSCIRQHTSAYVSIRQHTSAHVSIRQHTSAYVSIRLSPRPGRRVAFWFHICTSVPVKQVVNFNIRQHTAATRLAGALGPVFVLLYGKASSKQGIYQVVAPKAVNLICHGFGGERQYSYFCTSKASKMSTRVPENQAK